MREVEITIHLPEALVNEASRLGILSSKHIEALIRADIQAQLAAMANDPEIQRELAAIDEEFRVAEGDGLDDESLLFRALAK